MTPAQDRRRFPRFISVGQPEDTLPPNDIWSAFRDVRRTALGLLIVAFCAVGAVHSASAEQLSEDLSGRWASQRHGFVLDVTRCGTERCGIRLNADQSCGALALRLAPASGEQRQLIGTLNLGPSVQAYKVSATTTPAAVARPTEIQLLGNQNMPPQPMTRMIQFHDKLVRGGDATCRAEGKVS